MSSRRTASVTVQGAEAGADAVGAFVPGERTRRAALGEGPLSGLRFAVKDLFDVEGTVTGFGNPDWARTHPPAVATAPVVTALLQVGAAMVGKTKTVELAFGLTGENVWHGTPINPAAPSRFPGGSSCGSAAAVAAGLVDFALGSDTGGSVRIPASYCGIFGIRPSQGAVTLAGAAALAPSLDTAGWFTRSAELLALVGDTLLPGGDEAVAGPLLRVNEAWIAAEPGVADGLRKALHQLERVFGRALDVQIAPEGLRSFYDHFRAVQAEEAWATLGPWITSVEPSFGPGVAERFAMSRAIEPARVVAGRQFRRLLQRRLRPLLTGGAVLVYPTSPCPAPSLDSSRETQQDVREATLSVTAIAGLCGLPEVTLPAGTVGGAPVGLSLVAGPGRDRALLALARRAADALGLGG